VAPRSRPASAAALALVLGACGGGAGDDVTEPDPLVADIPAAVAALDPASAVYQVAGTPTGVEIVIQDGLEAVGYTYADGVLSAGTPLGPADGYTFAPADVDFDPAHVLDGVTGELDDPLITRFEVLGGPSGITYTAEVLSAAGGTLLVDLAGDGAVLGVVPEG
jgi:hypothetical protein